MSNLFSDKITSTIKSMGLKKKELATMLGVSAPHITMLCNGKADPSPQLVLALDRIIEDHHRNTLPAVLVPVYATVPAGPAELPIVAEEEPLDYVACPGNAANKGALLVTGHSMTPEINEGEFVIYERGAPLKPGDFVVATDEFNRAMVKEYAEKEGEPWLLSVNREYPNVRVNSHFKLIGKVIKITSSRIPKRG